MEASNNTHESEPKPPTTPSDARAAKPRKALLNRFITLSAAQAGEEDMVAELGYPEKRADFYNQFAAREREIQELVAFHCGMIDPDLVQVSKMWNGDELVWRHGSFNMCIPVCINSSGRAGDSLPFKLGFRVPLPYKVGEESFPGNAEEKVRSEAATYIYINENCPDIPIPKLRGFGVRAGFSLCEPRFVPFWQRAKFHIWRFFRRLVDGPASVTAIISHEKEQHSSIIAIL